MYVVIRKYLKEYKERLSKKYKGQKNRANVTALLPFILPFHTIHAIMTYYDGISVIVPYRRFVRGCGCGRIHLYEKKDKI